jgi:hypothetical protein
MRLSLFNHPISFNAIDPLGNGLGDEIFAEQREPEAIQLEEGVDEGQLSGYWQSVEKDIRSDEDFSRLSEEE